MKLHTGTVEHENKKINHVDIYKGFYKQAFRVLKKSYPNDGEERMLTYLTLKYNMLKHKDDLDQEGKVIRTRILREFDQKLQAIKNNEDLSDKEKNQLLQNLDFEQDQALIYNTTSPYYIWKQKRKELYNNYEANIRKVLGKAYFDIQVSLDSYNRELKYKYGNYYYYSDYDSDTGERLSAGHEIKVEDPKKPRFSLNL